MFEALSIVIVNIILYSYTLTFDLVMDDMQWYEKHSKGWFEKEPNILKLISLRLYSGGTFGFNKTIDHLVTMMMWTLLCVMSYFAFGASRESFIGALLLSCHPLMNQLSIWLNGRRYLVCAILLMGMMILFNTKLWVLALPLYLLSGLFQVTVFFAPVLFLMKMKYGWLALGTIGILLFGIKDWVIGKIKNRLTMIPCEDLRQWNPRRPIVIVKLFGFYFWKMLIPGRVSMIYDFIQMFGRTREGNEDAYSINGDFYRGCISFGLCGAMVYLLPHSLWPMAAFMILALIQWCAIIPVTQMLSDRYASISTIFMCFFISYLSLHYLPATIAYCVITAFMVQYLYSTIIVFKMYKNIDTWYDYHTENNPGNLAVTNLRIGMHLSQRRLFQANALLERALAIHPNDYALNYLGYISAMIFQNLVLAQGYINKCKTSIYLGEEIERSQEISDAELGLKAMSGQLQMNQPQRYPKKG